MLQHSFDFKNDSFAKPTTVEEYVTSIPAAARPMFNDFREQLVPYIKGKGTLWFSLAKPLPKHLLEDIVTALAS